MAAQTRTRKSSPQNKVKSFVSAGITIEPVHELDSAELERFEAIIASRELDTWTPADIATATHLAEVEIERDKTRKLYKAQGEIQQSSNGHPMTNPVFNMYNILFAQADKLKRSLGLSASQRAVSGHKQAKRNQQDKDAADKVSSLSSLMNRPDAG